MVAAREGGGASREHGCCFRHGPGSSIYLSVAVRDLALSPGSPGVGASVFPVSVSFLRRDSTMASLSPADSTSLLDPSPGLSFFVGLSPSLSAIVVSSQKGTENQDPRGYRGEILSLLFQRVGKTTM